MVRGSSGIPATDVKCNVWRQNHCDRHVPYSCPYCQTHAPPIWKSEVSQIGWIVFAILLVTTCVFCFAGLLIRDRYRVCSQCKMRLE